MLSQLPVGTTGEMLVPQQSHPQKREQSAVPGTLRNEQEFWERILPDIAAYFSTACGRIWPKLWEIVVLMGGQKYTKFHWRRTMYVKMAAKILLTFFEDGTVAET